MTELYSFIDSKSICTPKYCWAVKLMPGSVKLTPFLDSIGSQDKYDWLLLVEL